MLPPGTHPDLCFSETIIPADAKAQALFDNCFQIIDGPDAPTLDIVELNNEIIINITNAGSSNNVGESYNQSDPLLVTSVEALLADGDTTLTQPLDTTYTFQGYQIYQVASSNVSASDLNDPSQAQLIFQCDIRDGVADLINFETDLQLDADIPELKVEGADIGIQHSIRVTEDRFAPVNPALINHRTYYFAAVAYAYNNYKTYDPNFPTAGGQKQPYLQGRGNFNVYSAIPHNPDPRNNGTILNTEFGQGVELTRIEGRGNGGFDLDLDTTTINRYFSGGFPTSIDQITYAPNSGPVNIQIVDPTSVQNGAYQLRLIPMDTNEISAGTSIEQMDSMVVWRLFKDGQLIDTSSRLNFRQEHNQLVYDQNTGEFIGLAIRVGAPPVQLSNNMFPNENIYGAIRGEITYEDPQNPWLQFLTDELDGNRDVTNWIRSGNEYESDPQSFAVRIYDDNYFEPVLNTQDFHDPDEIFETMGFVDLRK
jgi:hypothetical protein